MALHEKIQLIDPGVSFRTAPLTLIGDQLKLKGVPVSFEHLINNHHETILATLRNPVPNFHALVGQLIEVGIPVKSSNRGNEHPILIGGGTGATNPFSLQFMDAVWIGDVTSSAFDAISLSRNYPQRLDKLKILHEAGYFVHSIENDGKPIRHKVKQPLLGVVVDKGIISLTRQEKTAFVQAQTGCGIGCTFCFDGLNPKFTMPQTTFQVLTEQIASQNPDIDSFRVSFPSLKASEFLGFVRILIDIKKRMDRDFSIDIGSTNPDQFTYEVAKSMVELGHRSITFAPEVAEGEFDGVDLRHTNKPWFTDKKLFEAIENGIRGGLEEVILYHMTGFPGETINHLQAYVDMVKRMRQEFPNLLVGVTSGILYPLPFTKLEKAPQLSFKDVIQRWNFFKPAIEALGVKTYWLLQPDSRYRSSEYPVTGETTYTQTYFHRGGREIGEALANYW